MATTAQQIHERVPTTMSMMLARGKNKRPKTSGKIKEACIFLFLPFFPTRAKADGWGKRIWEDELS
jgi:hypothetical protein